MRLKPKMNWKLQEFDMLLKEGDKILVAHRRLFEKDEVRFFVGQVAACATGGDGEPRAVALNFSFRMRFSRCLGKSLL
jgi:hypothetical protein